MTIFLLLNKPYGVASIPSVNHSNTIANFIKGYYVKQDYENQQVHIVTRLDRDTSGLMLFAKHGYAHARLDKQLQTKSLSKNVISLWLREMGIWSQKGRLSNRLRVMKTPLLPDV